MVEKTSLFDLVLTGQLAQGVERAAAVSQLALLFKMPVDKIEGLLVSAPVVLKRDMAWEVAKRYRAAIKQAGALSDIRPAEASRSQESAAAHVATERAEAPVAEPPVAEPPVATDLSLAAPGAEVLTPQERSVSASRLAEFNDFVLRPNEGNLLDAAELAPSFSAPAHLGEGFALLPPGTDVLADHERALPVAALVTTPDLEIASLGARLSQPATQTVPAPDTSHLTLDKL